MVGVFLLSALIGGGVAGLFLAMQGSVNAPQESAASSASISIITPEVPAGNEVGQQQGAPSASSGRAEQGKVAGNADNEDDIVIVTPASPTPSPSTLPEQATSSSAQQPRTASAAGARELQQLTEQVVSALGALGRAEQQGSVDDAAAGTDRLRRSLADLVDAALAKGKSDAEIRSLLSEALDNAGEVPALLRDASGKVDVQRLLTSIMSGMRADAVPMSKDERDYFNQLMAEADTTAVAPAAGKTTSVAGKAVTGAGKRKAGRFFVRNGKRYTVIRKGDTLSDIAYAAYGDVLAYSVILRANKGRISPRALKPGTRILIPDITTTRKTRNRKARRQGALNGSAGTGLRALATGNGNTSQIQAQPVSGSPKADVRRSVKITNFNIGHAGSRPLPLPGAFNTDQ